MQNLSYSVDDFLLQHLERVEQCSMKVVSWLTVQVEAGHSTITETSDYSGRCIGIIPTMYIFMVCNIKSDGSMTIETNNNI